MMLPGVVAIVTGWPSSAFVATTRVTSYGDPIWLARSPAGASTPFSAMCVALIVGCEMLHVGALAGQFTVTVDCVVGSVHAAVVGNWIDSALCPSDASCTAKLAAPLATVAVPSSVLPLLNSCTVVPSGAPVVIRTVYWNPSAHVLFVSSLTVSVAPLTGATNATE